LIDAKQSNEGNGEKVSGEIITKKIESKYRMSMAKDFRRMGILSYLI